MKQLLILRHAKSSWDDSALPDKKRPLNSRGKEDAHRIGKFIRQTENLPDLIYCSTAVRARQTIDLASRQWKEKIEIKWVDELYAGDVTSYASAVGQTSNTLNRILVAGHNPKIEQMLDIILAEEHKGLVKVPTGALVCIESNSDEWDKVFNLKGKIKWMVIPKLLKKLKSFK